MVRRSLAVLACVIAGTFPVYADIFSFSGTFSQDDDVQLFTIVLNSDKTLTVQSFGYGGGTSNAGSVPAGGFATELSLYDASGLQEIEAQDTTGGTAPSACGPRNIDSVTNFCFDAYITGPLLAGTYILALTEQGNDGPSFFPDGFPQAGNGNFAGGFLDPFDSEQRTNAWALDITGADSAEIPAAVPEPAVWTYLSFIALALSRRFRQQARLDQS